MLVYILLMITCMSVNVNTMYNLSIDLVHNTLSYPFLSDLVFVPVVEHHCWVLGTAPGGFVVLYGPRLNKVSQRC